MSPMHGPPGTPSDSSTSLLTFDNSSRQARKKVAVARTLTRAVDLVVSGCRIFLSGVTSLLHGTVSGHHS